MPLTEANTFLTTYNVNQNTVDSVLFGNNITETITITLSSLLNSLNFTTTRHDNITEIKISTHLGQQVYFYKHLPNIDITKLYTPNVFAKNYEDCFGKTISGNSLYHTKYNRLKIVLILDTYQQTSNVDTYTCNFFREFTVSLFAVSFNLGFYDLPLYPNTLMHMSNFKDGISTLCTTNSAKEYVYYFPYLISPMFVTPCNMSVNMLTVVIESLAVKQTLKIDSVQDIFIASDAPNSLTVLPKTNYGKDIYMFDFVNISKLKLNCTNQFKKTPFLYWLNFYKFSNTIDKKSTINSRLYNENAILKMLPDAIVKFNQTDLFSKAVNLAKNNKYMFS